MIFHCDKNFRGLNFTSYCRGKATLEKICRNITKNKNVVYSEDSTKIKQNKIRVTKEQFLKFLMINK